MVIMRHFGIIAALFSLQLWSASAQTMPPKITGSYMARGEIVEKIVDEVETTGSRLIQVAFEENFDADTKDAAFTLWQSGTNMTLIEANDVEQTFRYTVEGCSTITPSEWKDTAGGLLVKGYETEGDRIRFFLRELFSIDKTPVEGGVATEFRGIQAKRYLYEFDPIIDGKQHKLSVISYWSDPTWSTTSGDDVTPLGFKLSTFIMDEEVPKDVSVQSINIFAFVPRTVNKEVFAARQGLICAERKQLYNFPDLKLSTAISFHSDFVFPKYNEFKSVDTWFDIKNLLLRIDLDHVAGQQPIWMKEGRRFTSEITSRKLNAVFQMDVFQGKRNCSVFSLDKHEFDIQDLFDPIMEADLWSWETFFGYNNTKFIYIGNTEKRSIPCRVWQGIRNDWPQPSYNVTSLWEWCIYHELLPTDETVTFRDNEIPLLNLEITILESPSVPEGIIQLFPKGMRIIHHFYDVVNEDSEYMDAVAFDVARCYGEELRKPLQFQVNVTVTEFNAQMIQNATSDASFLLQWKNAICESSDLPPFTLRVTRVQATVYNDYLYVSFLILDKHPKMDEKIRNAQISLNEALEKLEDNIAKNRLTIKYSSKGQVMTMAAVRDSLKPPIDPLFIPHVITTPTIVTSGSTPWSTRTFPIISTETTTSTPAKVTSEKNEHTEKTTYSSEKDRTQTPVGTGTDSTEKDRTQTPTETGTGSTEKDRTQTPTETGTGSTEKDRTQTPTGTGTGTESITSPTVSSELTTLTPLKKGGVTGHPPGTVAAVSIVMLLVGITLGAGGTFFKFRGLPKFGRAA